MYYFAINDFIKELKKKKKIKNDAFLFHREPKNLQAKIILQVLAKHCATAVQ